jgi:anti-sigma regulatory factor (Ser/Thr protein kinase)
MGLASDTVGVPEAMGTDPFVHPALLYGNPTEYLAGTIPFIRSGLAAGYPVLVVVPGENLERIHAALGTDARRVALHDMSVAGRNPGRILPSVLLAFAAEYADRPVRIIGEPIWAGRSAVEYPACAQHEALINAAFTGRRATILCPYDTTRLDPVWLADAYRTHPVMWTATAQWDSPYYVDPVELAGTFGEQLPEPPAGAVRIGVEAGLAAVRRFAADRARAAGLSERRIVDLTIAVSELAGNTVAHAGGTGTVAVWAEDGHVVGQVDDNGYIRDALAGRIPVPPDQPHGGRGLFLVNQVCDLVRVHTEPGATTTRFFLRLR